MGDKRQLPSDHRAESRGGKPGYGGKHRYGHTSAPKATGAVLKIRDEDERFKGREANQNQKRARDRDRGCRSRIRLRAARRSRTRATMSTMRRSFGR